MQSYVVGRVDEYRMTKPPFFSVITPCYKYGDLLSETLESLQAQSFDAWECLVVDDGSTDESHMIACRYAETDPRIRPLRHEMNLGVAAARNTGIRKARGRYLLFLDADDLLLPQTLDVLWKAIRADLSLGDGLSVYCIPFCYFREAEVLQSQELRMVTGIGSEYADNMVTFARGNPIPVCCAAVPSALVNHKEAFDPSHLRLEDYDFWVRLVASGVCFRVLPVGDGACGACIRMHHDSLSENLPATYHKEVQLRTQWEYEELFGPFPLARRENLRRLANRSGRLLLLSLPSLHAGGRDTMHKAWQGLRSAYVVNWRLPWVLLRAAAGLAFGSLLQRTTLGRRKLRWRLL
ncbi:MAG: glycosyltransferase [Deltaproteobacteria bacterium]|nr:glycosyltransferase [Deltaproteobacteria bacterium]